MSWTTDGMTRMIKTNSFRKMTRIEWKTHFPWIPADSGSGPAIGCPDGSHADRWVPPSVQWPGLPGTWTRNPQAHQSQGHQTLWPQRFNTHILALTEGRAEEVRRQRKGGMRTNEGKVYVYRRIQGLKKRINKSLMCSYFGQFLTFS